MKVIQTGLFGDTTVIQKRESKSKIKISDRFPADAPLSRDPAQRQSAVKLPMLKVSHRYLVHYWQTVREVKSDDQGNVIGSESGFNGKFNFTDREGNKTAYQGEMSKGSMKRLQNACELMIAVTPKKTFQSPKDKKQITYRIGLLTLTLSAPQLEITDKQLKTEMLAPFIRKIKKYGLKNYIWKAERQANGNLHFHVFIDCYIPKSDISNIWNRLQSKFHFIRNFSQKYGHHEPPSTNIKCVKSTEGLFRYMVKYMLKPMEKGEQKEINSEERELNKGKVWDCSEALKIINNTASEAQQGDWEKINEAIELGWLQVQQKDHATIYYYTSQNSVLHLSKPLISRYKNYLLEVKMFSA